jgi:hypothetical protein
MIAVATVVNLFVSIGLWITTRDSVDVARHVFEAANRPYIGIEGIFVHNDSQKKDLSITVVIKNWGTVPGEKATIEWEVMLDGNAQPGTKVPDKAKTLFPGGILTLAASMGASNYERIINHQTGVTVKVSASYEGPGPKTYRYCEISRYEPDTNAFMNLGTCE